MNWELNVIKEHKLDKKYNLNIDITYLTNKNASAIALMSNAVDMIVTNWYGLVDKGIKEKTSL